MQKFANILSLVLLVSTTFFSSCTETTEPVEPPVVENNVVTATITDQNDVANAWEAADVLAQVNGTSITLTAAAADGSYISFEFSSTSTGNFAFNTGVSAAYQEDTATAEANSNRIFTSKDGSGSLQLTKYDMTTRQLSGTFSLDVVHGLSGTTYYITDGVFTNVEYN